MKYQDKERIVSEAWFPIMAHEAWSDVLKYGDLGFPLAYASQRGIATLTKEAQKFVEEVYAVLIQSLDIPDAEYTDFAEMNEKAKELHNE